MVLSFEEYLDELIKAGFYYSNLEPKVCVSCNSTDFEQKVEDTLDGHLVMEISVKCKNCGDQVGYWAHGVWSI